MKISLICQKCKKETLADDPMGNNLTGILVIDFFNKYLQFVCPECGFINEMDMGDIKKSLDNRTKLPEIRTSRF